MTEFSPVQYQQLTARLINKTPCYVIDESKLLASLDTIHQIQKQSGLEVLLALKGFSVPQLFPLMKPFLAGVAVSSLAEAKLGYAYFKGQMTTYSPAYIPREFDQIANLSQRLIFNSLSQWERYKNRIPKTVSCGLRVNPEYSEIQYDLYNPCIKDRHLGIFREQIGNTLPKGIEGIHFHALCESSAETLERTLTHFLKNFENLLHSVKWLNMGGGHLIAETHYNRELLIELCCHLSQKYDLQVIIEPSAGIVWKAGYLVASVLDIVKGRSEATALLDISFANHAPDVLEIGYIPDVVNIPTAKQGGYPYRMAGISCMAGDHTPPYRFSKPLKVGDLIVFDNMLHYTIVRNNNFNGIAKPSIILYKKDRQLETII